MAKRDYYEILGVERGAGEAELKQAYRRLAMKHHPDRNPDDKASESKFKEAKEAYEVLSDPQKRATYDQFGQAGLEGVGAAGAGGFHGGFADIFGDVFGDIFGGGRGGRTQASRGSDLRYTLDISLEDAVRGTEARIRIPKLESCGTCGGSGARAGTTPLVCSTCGGVGQVRLQQGFFAIQQTCPHCRGTGRVIAQACIACAGQGRVRGDKTLAVKVPAGIDDGDQVRISGEGEAGESGGPSGDLYVQMRLKPHPIFRREADDLHCEMPVSFVTAAIGGEIGIPTLEGRVTLKVPPETQSGKRFRVRGKGVRNVRTGAQGDLYCALTVETPVKLTKKQKDLLQEFDILVREGGERHNPQEHSWVDKLKSFFNE